MLNITAIALKDCKVFRPWKAVPNGRFIQVYEPHKTEPFLALTGQVPNVRREYKSCIVHLDGDLFANWASANSEAAVIDVTDQFELEVTELNPRALSSAEQNGFIYAHRDGAFFLRVRSENLTGFACLKPAGDYTLVTIYYDEDLNMNELTEVGRASLKRIERRL